MLSIVCGGVKHCLFVVLSIGFSSAGGEAEVTFDTIPAPFVQEPGRASESHRSQVERFFREMDWAELVGKRVNNSNDSFR